MADNVTVTPAASNIAFASGSTTHVTLSGNVSDSTSAYVGNIYVHGDQFDNTGFVIQNTSPKRRRENRILNALLYPRTKKVSKSVCLK